MISNRAGRNGTLSEDDRFFCALSQVKKSGNKENDGAYMRLPARSHGNFSSELRGFRASLVLSASISYPLLPLDPALGGKCERGLLPRPTRPV